MEKIGFGVIGLGSISETHARALQDQENCYLVGGFHRNHEKASSRQYDHIYIGKKDSNMSCMTH